jgi:DNA-binding CsgD family transcriptional regulator/tetratricopeptide (TPR) repeat protein
VTESLIGRLQERETIEGLVAALSRGRGGRLWIEGEPGIGKSTLLEYAAGEARRLECRVVHGIAEELTQRFPLRVLLDCLDPERHLSAVVGSDGELVPSDPVSAAIEALVERVEKLCTDGSLLLMVDDLQWADDASLLVWHRLSRLTDQLPLLLAGTCRRLPRSAALSALHRSLAAHDAVMVTLDQLPVGDIDPLVERITGAAAGPELQRLARGAGGNPLHVREVVEAYQRAGRIRVVDGTAELTEAAGAAPLPVAEAITHRLGFLSEETFALLRVAALLGVEFSVGDLSIVIGQPATEMIGAFEEAVAGGVLVERIDGLAFRHELLRHALYEGVPAGLRTALHQQAAQTLDAAGADVQTVAVQLAAAPVLADAWFVEWLVRSADQLAYRAPRVAAELLRHGLDGPVVDPARSTLLAQLASVLFLLSEFTEVDRLAQVPVADPDRAASLVWHRANALMHLDQDDKALQVVDDALADGSTPPDWTARLTAIRAVILVNAGRHDEAEAAALAVLDNEPAAGRSRDPIADARAQHVRMYAASMRGDDEAALAFVRTAVGLVADDPRAKDLHLLLLSNLAGVLTALDLPDVDPVIRDLLPAAERAGSPQRIFTARLTTAEHWFFRGRWDDAVTELGMLEEDLIDLRSSNAVWMHGLAALIAVHRGEDTAADQHIGAVTDLGLAQGSLQERTVVAGDVWHNSTNLRLAEAIRAERRGDLAAALAAVAVLGDAERAVSLAAIEPFVGYATRLALDNGDRDLAIAVNATAIRLGGTNPTRRAVRSWCAGLLDADPARLLEAAALFETAGRSFDRASVLEDAAVLLAKGGDTAAARRWSAEAIEIYETLQASWNIQRADARLREHGVRRGQRGARRRPDSGWAALTPTELKVTGLDAEGLSNPDIASNLVLSRRTVETHISHILTKLDVRSRTEIVRHALSQAQ